MEWQLLSSSSDHAARSKDKSCNRSRFSSTPARRARAAGAPARASGYVAPGWGWAGREGGLLGGPEMATTDCCARRPVELSQG